MIVVEIVIELERTDLVHLLVASAVEVLDLLGHDRVPHQVVVEGNDQRALGGEVVPGGEVSLPWSGLSTVHAPFRPDALQVGRPVGTGSRPWR